MDAADYFGPHGSLAKRVDGYEYRPSQLAMARAVDAALRDDGVLLVEAGTGTGKTWAYLVPAILSERRVVISTATRTLQDQIIQHDLPLLLEKTGLKASVVALKGLNNYLCLRRYQEFLSMSGAQDGTDGEAAELLRQWVSETSVGDRAELSNVAEDWPVWPRVMSGSDTRIGAKCPHYEDCFVTKIRRRAEQAQIVVVNHHLFFADLAIRGPHAGSVIPDYDAVIFDEAHRIEDVATEFFGASISTTKIERLIQDLRRGIPRLLEKDFAKALDNVMIRTSFFFGKLPRKAENGRYSLREADWTEALKSEFFALDDALNAVTAVLERVELPLEIKLQYRRRIDGLRQTLSLVDERQGEDRVRWLQVSGGRTTVGSSPVHLGNMLRERLFDNGGAAVLTSATLTTRGNFDFIRDRLGIDEGVEQKQLQSTFDFPNQAALYLPASLPDPRSEQYLGAATDEIIKLIELTGGGAFLLCTSHRMMHAFSKRLKPLLQTRVIIQGDAPKQELIDLFRKDGHAVLIATSTFWEGVDVAGDALRLVIIDKLPFEVPSDPIVDARCKEIERRGESAFMRYLVPAAALSLKQGFGRLIRTGRDFGIVAVLDSRVVNKGYGKSILKSLPEATRCDTFDQAAAFYRRGATTRTT